MIHGRVLRTWRRFNIQKSSFTHLWVVYIERICSLTHLGGSQKYMVKSYTPFNDLFEVNVALRSIRSVRHGMAV